MKSLPEFSETIHKMYMDRIIVESNRIQSLESNVGSWREDSVYTDTGPSEGVGDTNEYGLQGTFKDAPYKTIPFGQAANHDIMEPTEYIHEIPDETPSARPWYKRYTDEFENLGKGIAAMVDTILGVEGESEIDA